MSDFNYRFLFCRPNVGEFDFLMYAIIDFIFISVHYKFYCVLPLLSLQRAAMHLFFTA